MTNKKSILCIVPLPPPITGAAGASETIVNYLKQYHEIVIIPYQRGNLISGKFSLKQLFKIVIIGIRLKLMKRKFDIIYLVISSNFWGNLRDLFLFIMLGHRLRNKTVIHLHGGNIDRYLNKAPPLIKHLNKKMLGDVKNAIVLGETFFHIFDGYIPGDKIKIVKNYFVPDLLISERNVSKKYNDIKKINILYLSNLIKEKGYEVLLDAFLSLPESVKGKATLHFAGEIYSAHEKEMFMAKIKNNTNIFYHGIVRQKKKRNLLWDSHIFCLPTFYKYEGQPISILEAYASGCIVLTTSYGGINDIFLNNTNGLSIDADINTEIDILKEKLKETLEMLIMDVDKYKHIANFNIREASEKYTKEIFCNNIEQILLNNDVGR